jgi:hypothetical protein
MITKALVPTPGKGKPCVAALTTGNTNRNIGKLYYQALKELLINKSAHATNVTQESRRKSIQELTLPQDIPHNVTPHSATTCNVRMHPEICQKPCPNHRKCDVSEVWNCRIIQVQTIIRNDAQWYSACNYHPLNVSAQRYQRIGRNVSAQRWTVTLVNAL